MLKLGNEKKHAFMSFLCVFTTHVGTLFQPLTEHTDITSTAGVVIISKFELSKHVLKMLIVIVVHQVMAISYI